MVLASSLAQEKIQVITQHRIRVLYNSIVNDPKLSTLLKKLPDELGDTFGENLSAVYLYGSQARGDAHPDSDIDVLVVLRDEFSYFDVVNKNILYHFRALVGVRNRHFLCVCYQTRL